MSSRRTTLEKLSAEQRAVLLETGTVAAKNLTTRIRNLDAQAFGRLKDSKKVVTLTAEEKAKWTQAYEKTWASLVEQGTFPAELVSKLEQLAK